MAYVYVSTTEEWTDGRFSAMEGKDWSCNPYSLDASCPCEVARAEAWIDGWRDYVFSAPRDVLTGLQIWYREKATK